MIADYSSGTYVHLVVTGEQRGTIWINDRFKEGGTYPFSKNLCYCFHGGAQDMQHNNNKTQPLNFYNWDDDWLNKSLDIQGKQ